MPNSCCTINCTNRYRKDNGITFYGAEQDFNSSVISVVNEDLFRWNYFKDTASKNMLEGLAAWILNTYVGEYLENLNTDQLSIGLLQGEVELENLPLKKDALKYIGLPVEIRAGFVGKIKLQIPVRRLRSEPWVIFIERLFLVAGPVLSSQYDEEKEEKAVLNRKLAHLEALEAKWKAEHEAKQEPSTYSYTNWLTYGTSLFANIVENLQLKVKDVHIRYEDEEMCPNSNFACGIIIHNLSAQSTDENWVPKFVTRDSTDMMWKLVQLDGLSAYWDTSATMLGHLDMYQMATEMAKHLENSISSEGNTKDHDYILSPVNAKAYMKRNCSPKPLRSRSMPRIICDLHLEKIPLSLSEVQYRQIMEWEREFECLDIKWKYRKWRPSVPVKDNAKQWWVYAISVYLEPLKKHNEIHTWSFVLQRAHDIVEYTKAYHAYLSKPDSLPSSIKAVKDELECKLSFDDLCILREMVMEKVQKEYFSQDIKSEQSKGQGFLQWMFPGWGGWYSSQSELEEEHLTCDELHKEESYLESKELKNKLEEEILDVLDSAENDTLLKRDTVFAQVNFSLSQGTFTLIGNPTTLSLIHPLSQLDDNQKNILDEMKPIIELEFSDVSTKLETRPRTGSLLFEIKLGALYLHDRLFSKTSFPHIVAPQNREISFPYPRPSGYSTFPFPAFLSRKPGEADASSPLFELLYEKKPLHVSADHRLVITTRSLDVVYNPQIINHITDFFSFHHGKVTASEFSVSDLRLTAAARARYEVLKQQTKAELRQKWDQILDGEEKPLESSKWSIELAISAPQIIIPENIFDKNSLVVVFDLGRLHFYNVSKDSEVKNIPVLEDADEDEDFLTPCSTPQDLSEQMEVSPTKSDTLADGQAFQCDSDLFKEHLYERYTLELSEIQVLVSRLRDNWKFAQLRGTSTMHILDRFSISVQMERRMIFVQDPQWPSVTLSGNLPKLIVHVSEQKVSALQTCINIMNTPVISPQKVSMDKTLHNEELNKQFENVIDFSPKGREKESDSKQSTGNQKELDEESLLLLMQFCVDQMSFDVQSRGRSVAELQVTGVKVTFSKRPHDTSVTLCVHSLLLVDALQTYGPDFELLVASHKHVSMDSTSGSLLDSEPNSPVSPASPDPVNSPRNVNGASTSASVLSAALSNLQNLSHKVTARQCSSSPQPFHGAQPPLTSEPSDNDALIIVEFNIIESSSYEEGDSDILQIATVQFNNLDVIANQETIVELVGFVKRISLQNAHSSHVTGDISAGKLDVKPENVTEISPKKHVSKTEITFDFHRLNVLLLRAVSQNYSTVGQKVATATMSGTRIQATIGSTIHIQGALGGLQVLDLFTENSRHQKILSVGHDPLFENSSDLLSRLQEDMYKPLSHSIDAFEPQKALTFAITRSDKSNVCASVMRTVVRDINYLTLMDSNRNESKGELDVTIRMASVCYTHSPRLLYELSSCATEFKEYMSTLVSSIKTAAAEVAIGIVTKRTESISATLHGTPVDSSPSKKRHESVADPVNETDFQNHVLSETDVTVELKIDVLLQTPVVVIPCSPTSSDVFVAHLGRIAVQNANSGYLSSHQFFHNSCDTYQEGTIFVEVRDMNLYFLNTDSNVQRSSTQGSSVLLHPSQSVRELYSCEQNGQPILHDTVIEVLLQQVTKCAISTADTLDNFCFGMDFKEDNVCNTGKVPCNKQIKVKGRVVTPLKVVLTKHQYQQMLNTLDNLTYDEPASLQTCSQDLRSSQDGESVAEFLCHLSASSTSLSKQDMQQHLFPAIGMTDDSNLNQHTSVQAIFELPDFTVELRGDLNEREQGLVSLTFQEFVLRYEKEKMHETVLQVTLHALLMEDLRDFQDSRHCYLMMSSGHDQKNEHSSVPLKSFISSSCPDMSEYFPRFYSSPSSSLPDHLHTQNLFSLQNSSKGTSGLRVLKNVLRAKSTESYPSTPPPSPSGMNNKELSPLSSKDALVHINILLVDNKSPLYATKHRKINRFVDIDFNCLDVTLNMQTWVMVLDFFGIGSGSSELDKHDVEPHNMFKENIDVLDQKHDKDNLPEVFNSEVELTVRSLTVILNKSDYKLASANISNYYSHISLRNNNFSIRGKLGSISVTDLTPHGHLYPERFVTTGTEALHFDVFRYGKPDVSEPTDYDIRVKCQMSSVRYVHTHRFLSETTAFFQCFTQMQDLMGRIRAAAAGVIINPEATRGSRISLDISAGSPVIVIPQNSTSSEVLVANLGRLTVHNTFLFAGSAGTISCSTTSASDINVLGSENENQAKLNQSIYGSLDSDLRASGLEPAENLIPVKKQRMEVTGIGENHVCLLDVINVELADMDLYSAVHLSRTKTKTQINKTDQGKHSEESDLLFPSFFIRKQGPQLLQEKFMFRVQVERNLDAAISHAVPDMTIEGIFSSVHVTLNLEQYKLICGILNYNLGEPLEEFLLDPAREKEQFILVNEKESSWTSMAIHMDLVNVTLELVRNNALANKPGEAPLAKFDFIKSRLSYESFSDNSKDIDLVSNEIRVSDTRYKDSPVNSRPNVFTNILQPTKRGETKNSVLQAELHYRMTQEFTRFTVLLNNMRIMGVFDWLQNVLEFIITPTSSHAANQKPTYGTTSAAMKSSTVASNNKYQQKKAPHFEMKLNVTDTELVVVEDTSLWDTNAVILKSTAVITWKPESSEKPLSCSLQSLEVFSCILGIEEDTALSIIDPVTVNIDIIGKPPSPIAKLQSDDPVHTLEISMINVNLRLSYYDITMFLQIMESIKKQTGVQFQKKSAACLEMNYSDSDVCCLESLGFSTADCQKALATCNGKLDDAALWLTQHASPRSEVMLIDLDEHSDHQMEIDTVDEKKLNLHSVEIRLTSCCLCIIDDCKDADVPLIELTVSDVTVLQKLLGNYEGHSAFIFSGNYYNRALSGWEPVMEPWKCNMKWNIFRSVSKPSKKIACHISADDVINFNITSAFLDLYKTVKRNWTEDYLKINNRNRESSGSDVHSPGCYRRRSPFIPFALKNDTGSKLWFATLIRSADRLNCKQDQFMGPVFSNKVEMSWTEVTPGQVIPVPFESRAKIRHKDSHEMKIHQIIVRVDGWQQVAPVSVDRVGVYFRQAKPQISRSAAVYSDIFPARIVFKVTLEGSAKKLITVQSALLLRNKLEDAVEIKLESAGVQYGVTSTSLFVIPQQTIPIPLQFVHSQIWARPSDRFVSFCDHPITWHHVTKPREIGGVIRVCKSIRKASVNYRFAVSVKRDNYPSDKPQREPSVSSISSHQIPLQPGHILTFIPPLEVTNLLPYELHYCVKDMGINGFIKAGKGIHMYDINISNQFGMELSLENFKRCNELIVSSTSRRYPSRLELYDNQDRLLLLQLRVTSIPGGALKLFVSAPYWLVNRTGLPLVFKQEGTHIEAAGQFEEHELARSMAPLLFSFSDRDASAMCNMRVGKSLHPESIPQWCTRFHLEKGVRVQRLHVTRRDSRPDWVYNIGIDVRMGRGRYRDTNIVTLSPRYQLDNSSSHKLEFCQLFATKELSRQYVLSSMPKCNLPFHWPRIDLDNLLCVRLTDIPDCYWSGGFAIDNIDSFHINMRDGQGKSHFLRVDIILQGATFFIVFTDADRMPPPFRIDNHSEVSVTYYQTNVSEERLKTSVRPHSSVPYAWDESTLPPFITCCAPGGSVATYNMNIFREGSQLFYENFIYIAFTGTFLSRQSKEKRHNFSPQDIACQQFVLDVPQGTRVVINRKEAGKRSQLWRMTSTGMLQHEGSSPPRDPHRPQSMPNVSRVLVLDIAGLGPQPGEFVPLMLRKPDERRQLTQTWKFTSDGRLRCGHPNMYVQAKDGFVGIASDISCDHKRETGLWRLWNDVVLGPTLPVSFMTMENGVPVEQAISRQKLRGGSGVLSVRIVPDGPTRVLQITDLKQKRMVSMTSPATDWVVVEDEIVSKHSLTDIVANGAENPEYPSKEETLNGNDIELQICLQLSGGTGLSLVNHLSEELLYIMLHNIMIEYSKAACSHSLDGSIKNIQMDNQLREAERPVVLFVTPSSKTDNQRHLPAVHFTIHKVATPLINAEIFKHLIVTIRNLTLQLEERLLMKLLQFAGFNQSDAELEKMDETDNQIQRSLAKTTAYDERYYFSTLKLSLQQVRLSVLTTSHLPLDLQCVKKKMGLRLIRFEDAVVELDPFLRVHPFETAQFLVDNIIEHYKEELKSQATKILGAVDFLGNPLGLMNDVTDGISGLIHEGNVGGLIKNVAHGLSDSAAKLSDTLSDGLGLVAMDDKHQKMRKRIRQESVAAGNDHLMAGIKGLGFGLLGGVTSLFTQTYEGAAQEGIQGFLSGLGKGLVGTVAKPAVGFLDFASGAASAVRDTSKRNSLTVLARCRPPRICVGNGGLLPPYSLKQALGQEYLYNMNDRNYNELFIAQEQLRSGTEDLQVLISSEQVYFLSSGTPSSSNVVLLVPLGDLFRCTYVYSEAGVVGEVRHYLQLTMKTDSTSGVSVSSDQLFKRHSISDPNEQLFKKPQVRCDSKQIAIKGGEDGKHHQGVGWLLSRHASDALLGYECINERILTAKFQTSIKDLKVICCYAPTEDADEDEKDRFYRQLQDILNSVKKGDITLLLGDFNAKVVTECNLWGGVIGPFGIGICNDNGQRLLQVAQQINYAKSLHEERTYMVVTDSNEEEDRDLS